MVPRDPKTWRISRFLNDKLMLRKVGNVNAMIDDRSIAVGCVQAGATISTALIFADRPPESSKIGETTRRLAALRLLPACQVRLKQHRDRTWLSGKQAVRQPPP